MKTGRIKERISVILAALILAAATFGGVQAGSYVSLRGGFYIQLPENWEQLDYKAVDAVLRFNQADRSSFDYEAAFAQRDSLEILEGNYMILDVDPSGEISDNQIDSVLARLSSVFGRKMLYAPVADLNVGMRSRAPSYDREEGIVTVLSDLTQPGKKSRKSLLVMKFYEKGMASFYFNSPEELYKSSHEAFINIVKSLSTENIEEALPKETLKVTDVGGLKEENESAYNPVFLYAAVAVLLILFVMIRRRKRTRS